MKEWIDHDELHIRHEQGYLRAICKYKPQDITWCQLLLYDQPGTVAAASGNELTLELWYKSAAILIRIPKWSDHHQKLIAISTGEYCDNKN